MIVSAMYALVVTVNVMYALVAVLVGVLIGVAIVFVVNIRRIKAAVRELGFMESFAEDWNSPEDEYYDNIPDDMVLPESEITPHDRERVDEFLRALPDIEDVDVDPFPRVRRPL